MRNRINMPNKKQEVDSMRSIDPQPTYAIKDNIMDTPDKQANYRSYFLRMYLIITQVWKMAKANRPNATNPSTTSSPWKKYSGNNPSLSITNHPIALFKNSKAHIPKMRARNFFCFAINSLFIMEECRLFVTSVTKPVLTGWNRASEGSIGHIKILAELGCLDAD